MSDQALNVIIEYLRSEIKGFVFCDLIDIYVIIYNDCVKGVIRLDDLDLKIRFKDYREVSYDIRNPRLLPKLNEFFKDCRMRISTCGDL